MGMIQYPKVLLLVKKVECSIFYQKSLIFGPSVVRNRFFSKNLDFHLINTKTWTLLKRYKFKIQNRIFFPYFCATFKLCTSKKRIIFITVINIRSCPKVEENTINSLKLVYSRKKLKIGYLVFTRLIKTDGLNLKKY